MSETATPSTTAAAAPSKPRDVEETELAALLRPERLSVVDFSATWCGPCRRLEPILGELAAELPGIDFFKLDADRSQQLAMRWGVQAVPTIVVLRDGRVVDRMVGLRPKGELADRLRELDAAV
jgi:thioredoxin 1